MKKKIGIILIVLCLIGIIVTIVFMQKKENTMDYPKISLIGDRVIELSEAPFKDSGVVATDTIDGDITTNVKMTEKIDYKKIGTYEILYEVTNSRNKKVSESRFVIVKEPMEYLYTSSYDEINNQDHSWWSNNKKNQTRPSGGYSLLELKKYQATFLGADELVIYLTFDEGSNQTFVNEIVDVLNRNEVKATFFLCKNYILDNAETMKKLVDGGHSVGNHTANHVKMSEFANKEGYDRFVREVKVVEESFFKVTGTNLDKVYREPKGEWSERSLKMVADLGYKTFFWSASYMDFNGELSKESAYNSMMKLYHNGAIYLIHPNNKGNYLALEDFIKTMKEKGFRFDLVKNIEI